MKKIIVALNSGGRFEVLNCDNINYIVDFGRYEILNNKGEILLVIPKENVKFIARKLDEDKIRYKEINNCENCKFNFSK